MSQYCHHCLDRVKCASAGECLHAEGPVQRRVRLTFRHTGKTRGSEYQANRGGKEVARLVRLAGRNPDLYYTYSLATDVRFNTAGQVGMTLDAAKAFVIERFSKPNIPDQATCERRRINNMTDNQPTQDVGNRRGRSAERTKLTDRL